MFRHQSAIFRESTNTKCRKSNFPLHLLIAITVILKILKCSNPEYIKLKSKSPRTLWKVAGSIPDGVIGIFHWRNPSGGTIALGTTQCLTDTSTRNISWGVKASGAWGWQPYHLHVPRVSKSGNLKLLEPSGRVQVCTGVVLPKAYDCEPLALQVLSGACIQTSIFKDATIERLGAWSFVMLTDSLCEVWYYGLLLFLIPLRVAEEG